MQPSPSAFIGEGDDTRQRRLGDDDQIHPLADMPRSAVKRVEKMRASRACPFPLWSEHEAVDRQGVLVRREQLRQAHALWLAILAGGVKNIVLEDLSAGRERTAARSHALDMPP